MPHPFPWSVKKSESLLRSEWEASAPLPRYSNAFFEERPFEPDAQVVDDDGVVIPGFDWLSLESAEAIVRVAEQHRDYAMHERLLAFAEQMALDRQMLINRMWTELRE